MKKTALFLIAAIVFPLAMTAGSDEHVSEMQGVVYICTGNNSKRYHESPNCRGLGNCQGDIVKVTVEKARSMGRTPCKICN